MYGLVIKPGKPTPYVPPPDGAQFLLRNASLAPEAQGRSALTLKTEGTGTDLCLGVLASKGGSSCMALDLMVDEYAEFCAKGNAEIHLVGLMVGDDEDDDDDDDDDDMDSELMKALGQGGEGIEDDEGSR